MKKVEKGGILFIRLKNVEKVENSSKRLNVEKEVLLPLRHGNPKMKHLVVKMSLVIFLHRGKISCAHSS